MLKQHEKLSGWLNPNQNGMKYTVYIKCHPALRAGLVCSRMRISVYSKSLKWIMLMLLIPTISWLAYSSILTSFLWYKESGFKCMLGKLWKLNWLLRKEAKQGIYDLVFCVWNCTGWKKKSRMVRVFRIILEMLSSYVSTCYVNR